MALSVETRKKRALAAFKSGDYTKHQIMERWKVSFYTLQKWLEEAAPSDNDNAKKIALANKALVKANEPDPVGTALKQLADKIPNLRRLAYDAETGEATIQVLNTYHVKVT